MKLQATKRQHISTVRKACIIPKVNASNQNESCWFDIKNLLPHLSPKKMKTGMILNNQQSSPSTPSTTEPEYVQFSYCLINTLKCFYSI